RHAFANVGDAEKKRPAAGYDGAGQIGRRGVDRGQREFRLVAAAPAAETLRIEQAEIDRRALLASGIVEGDGQPRHAGRYVERKLAIGLVIGAGEGAAQSQSVRGFGHASVLPAGIVVRAFSRRNARPKSLAAPREYCAARARARSFHCPGWRREDEALVDEADSD